MKKLSKKETEAEITGFFSGMKSKKPEDIKKIKKLAMRHGLKLKELKKRFCKKCFSPYSGKEKIRVRKGIKSIKCANCSYISRWRISSS